VRVALFVPCFLEHLRPDVALAAARVLGSLGCEVLVPPGQTCCGQPLYNTGGLEAAVPAARHFLRLFGELADGIPIVCPSGSCASMVVHHYAELPLEEADRRLLDRIAPRVWEFTRFLVEALGAERLDASLPAPRKVALHLSCHALRRLGVAAQPRALLERIGGIELVALERPEECCGFGGAFSVRLPEVSCAMADDKLDDALAAGAEELVGVDTSCLEHLAARARRRDLPIRCRHLAEVLAEGMGLA